MEDPIESLTKSVPSWGTRIAFGEGSTVGGRDVVPAALVIFGFGGGGGSSTSPQGGAAPEGEGSGGGGGGCVLPLGAYVAGPGGPTFQPNPVALIVASVPLVTAAGWAMARIIAAARRGRTPAA